jgi:hypothetical protein
MTRGASSLGLRRRPNELTAPSNLHELLDDVRCRLDELCAIRTRRGFDPSEQLRYEVLCKVEVTLLKATRDRPL